MGNVMSHLAGLPFDGLAIQAFTLIERTCQRLIGTRIIQSYHSWSSVLEY